MVFKVIARELIKKAYDVYKLFGGKAKLEFELLKEKKVAETEFNPSECKFTIRLSLLAKTRDFVYDLAHEMAHVYTNILGFPPCVDVKSEVPKQYEAEAKCIRATIHRYYIFYDEYLAFAYAPYVGSLLGHKNVLEYIEDEIYEAIDIVKLVVDKSIAVLEISDYEPIILPLELYGFIAYIYAILYSKVLRKYVWRELYNDALEAKKYVDLVVSKMMPFTPSDRPQEMTYNLAHKAPGKLKTWYIDLDVDIEVETLPCDLNMFKVRIHG